MLILGTTRSGKLIYVDFKYNQIGEIEYIFPDFTDIEDQFDAWVVFDLIQVKEFRKGSEITNLAVSKGAEHFGTKVMDSDTDITGSMSIGDRIALARSLVNSEFLD